MLTLAPLTLKEANGLVARLHRHHKPAVGHRFSIGVKRDGELVGAAIVGRPVARLTDWTTVAEVTRLVTDGTPHACSMLYAASARAARAMGYSSIQTFILEEEPGTSLVAAGWKKVGEVAASESWDSRPGRRNDQPRGAKTKWAKRLDA